MIIKVIPQRLMQMAEELRESKKALVYAGYSVEEVIGDLKLSEDESMQTTAAGLAKALQLLRIKIKLIDTITVALDRIAAIYNRAENSAASYEDETDISAYTKYKATDIDKIRIKAAHTFDGF